MSEEQIALFQERSPEEVGARRPSRVQLAQSFFAGNTGWEDIDAIHARLRLGAPRLGYATIYRVMRLLQELGYVEREDRNNTIFFHSTL